jgi:hypothetical protein
VNIWWDKLVLSLPGFCDGLLILGTDFIVKYLEVNLVALLREAFHDGIVGCHAVHITPILEWG